MHYKVMEITLLIMRNHGKIEGIVFLNFCGNLVMYKLYQTGNFYAPHSSYIFIKFIRKQI